MSKLASFLIEQIRFRQPGHGVLPLQDRVFQRNRPEADIGSVRGLRRPGVEGRGRPTRSVPAAPELQVEQQLATKRGSSATPRTFSAKRASGKQRQRSCGAAGNVSACACQPLTVLMPPREPYCSGLSGFPFCHREPRLLARRRALSRRWMPDCSGPSLRPFCHLGLRLSARRRTLPRKWPPSGRREGWLRWISWEWMSCLGGWKEGYRPPEECIRRWQSSMRVTDIACARTGFALVIGSASRDTHHARFGWVSRPAMMIKGRDGSGSWVGGGHASLRLRIQCLPVQAQAIAVPWGDLYGCAVSKAICMECTQRGQSPGSTSKRTWAQACFREAPDKTGPASSGGRHRGGESRACWE